MNIHANQSRTILLIFDEYVFYERLKSVNKLKQALLVTRLTSSQNGSEKASSIVELLKDDSDKLKTTKSCYSEVNKYLGLETDLLFFDAKTQFDVNAFTAISGTLIGGGELVLLLDSRLKSIIKSGEFGNSVLGVSKTLLRFLKMLSSHKLAVSKELKSGAIRYAQENIDEKQSRKARLAFENSQEQLIQAIKRCAVGHAKRPIILSANRGRGKSASLGLATAELLKETEVKVYITAPRKQQLSIFYRHLQQRLEQLTNQTQAKLLIEEQLIFLPPDEACSLKTISGLLIVEEAGALPTQLLSRFLTNSNRMIFSTTVDGYEGNGQGFAIRFKDLLKNAFPQYKDLTLTQPIRWPHNDLFEEILNSAFLLNVSKAEDIQLNTDTRQAIAPKFQLIQQQELFTNELLLKPIYRLLVNAHYQTRPSDLEKILSQESLYIFVAKYDKQIVGAALVCREGRLTKNQLNQIEHHNARIPGQLLPQSLVAHQGLTIAADLSFLRIMRIAVDSGYRRKGIASQLLSFIDKFASKNNIDLIGASFSLFTDVVRLWYENGFSAIRIGTRKDSSTGSHTGEFLKVVNHKNKLANELFNLGTDKFNRSFYYIVSSSLKIVSSDVLLNIAMTQPALCTSKLLESEQYLQIRSEVERYLTQKRSLEMVEWQLYEMTKLCLSGVKTNLATKELNQKTLINYELVFAKVIQRKNWQEVISQFQFSGIKQSREQTRLAFQSIFDHVLLG